MATSAEINSAGRAISTRISTWRKASGFPSGKAFNSRWERDFLNFFNHPNFAFPITDIDNSEFGHIEAMVSQPTTIYGSGLGADAAPRVVEFEGKINF